LAYQRKVNYVTASSLNFGWYWLKMPKIAVKVAFWAVIRESPFNFSEWTVSKDPIPVFEYVEGGIGVVREQATGTLISVVSRVGSNLDKLDALVQKGKGDLSPVKWTQKMSGSCTLDRIGKRS